jgi:hypothetical protein
LPRFGEFSVNLHVRSPRFKQLVRWRQGHFQRSVSRARNFGRKRPGAVFNSAKPFIRLHV